MNYIYDVLLNFKEEYYDFYDWNKTDNIIHIRKIPVFRISTYDLFNIINYNIEIDKSFLEKINNKTELFTNNGIRRIKNMCLFSDGDIIIGVDFNKNKISSLLIDEELDFLEDIYRFDIYDIKYTKNSKKNNNFFITRRQNEKIILLNKILPKIKEKDKLEYLYYECYNKKEKDINKIIFELNKTKDEKIVEEIYNFLNLIKVNNE